MADAKFSLGEIVITATAKVTLPPLEVLQCLARHVAGDWGDLCSEDWQANEQSLQDGMRLFSVYHDYRRTRFYIITEADRSVTTILLPEDY